MYDSRDMHHDDDYAAWENGNRTKEIELMELGLTCSKFLTRS